MLDIYFPVFHFLYEFWYGDSSPKTLLFQSHFARSLFSKWTCDGGVSLESKRQLVLGVLYGLIQFLAIFNIQKMFFLAKLIIMMIGNDEGCSELVWIGVYPGEHGKMFPVSWGNDLLWLCFSSVHASALEFILPKGAVTPGAPEGPSGARPFLPWSVTSCSHLLVAFQYRDKLII